MIVKSVKTRISKKSAFTLIELLVAISIIALLMAILMPVLAQAKKQCRASVCRSNIRQIFLANTSYALKENDFYVQAARDFYVLDNGSRSRGGKYRWHGVRQSDGVSRDPVKNIFDPLKGPFSVYLNDGRVKKCPSIVKFVDDGHLNAFEAGCGGYGYNSVGVGSRTYQYGTSDSAMRSSMKYSEIRQPADKIMFADTAFAQGIPRTYVIEYSFCEPPMFVLNMGKKIKEVGQPQPSIHFRHLGKTIVAWCDGHISAERLDFPEKAKSQNEMFQIGWFGPTDNALFRPN